MTFELPRIRLDLEHMRYSVVHALGTHNREIEKYVGEELERQIGAFDYAAAIKAAVAPAMQTVIRQAVDDFFRNGGGASLVYSAVSQELAEIADLQSKREAAVNEEIKRRKAKGGA